MSRKTKKILKKIGLIILGVGAVGAVGMGGKALYDYAKNDLQTIHPTFEVGGLGDDGKYVNDELSLYTKDSFACEGLSAKLDFDSEISYQFYFYDINDNFISSSEVYTEGANANIPLNGAYARVEITPTNDEDGKISFKERFDYSSQLNLKVSKKAESNVNKKFVSFKGENLQVVNNVSDLVFEYGKCWTNDGLLISSEKNSATSVTLLNVENFKSIDFDFNKLTEFAMDFSIIEFSELPNNDSVFTYTTSESSIEFKKDTKYILISIYCENSVSMSDLNSSILDILSLNK